ncbi:MAG: diphthamide synthesis protein [Candidatus Woesearchaeota archaeon]
MRVMFVEARSKLAVKLSKAQIAMLPKRVGVCATVQHVHDLDILVRQIEATGRCAVLITGKHSKYKGQILGCDVLADCAVDTYIFVGTGGFHIGQFAGLKPVFTYNPETKRLQKQVVHARNKGAYCKFLAAERVGVIVSVKHRQNRLQEALGLQKKYRAKKFYFLLFDDVDFGQLENFPFIECFVNTACPRLAYDEAAKFPKPVVDLRDI